MNAVLIKAPANLSGYDLRQNLLEALGGIQDPETLEWGESATIHIPEAGTASGTSTSAGAQICQLLYAGTQPELESALQDASLSPYNVVGFKSFLNEYQGDDQDGNPIYAPTVTTAIENGTLQYLNKRYSDEAQTVELPKNVTWFPVYSHPNRAEWVAA